MVARRSRARTGHDSRKLRLGISACLLGERVRHDGDHKRDAFVADCLRQFVTFVPVCPEVEIGMGTPREPIEIVVEEHGMRLRTRTSRRDLTECMRSYAGRRVEELRTQDLCGYILKSRSPSCGLRDTPLHHTDGAVAGTERGFFARALTSRHPRLPVEDEARLANPVRRDHFLTRVFAFHRLRAVFDAPWSFEDVERFHVGESFLLLSHDPRRASHLEDLVRQKRLPREQFAESYRDFFLATLEAPPTVIRHAEVLRRLVACLEDALDQSQTRDIYRLVDDFEGGRAARGQALSWIRDAASSRRLNGLGSQSYLAPYPALLMREPAEGA